MKCYALNYVFLGWKVLSNKKLKHSRGPNQNFLFRAEFSVLESTDS